MKTYSLALGTIQNINENLLNGVLPDRLIIGLVSSSSLNGELHSSPFDFQDYGLKEITVSANGEQYYTRTYKVDFEKERIAEVYYNLYNGLGLTGCNEGPDITLFQYRDGKTLFVFNIRHINDGFCLPRHGNIKIELKFSQPLTTALNVICHADYQSTLCIDNKKSIYFKEI
jgi:hypothetical protein